MHVSNLNPNPVPLFGNSITGGAISYTPYPIYTPVSHSWYIPLSVHMNTLVLDTLFEMVLPCQHRAFSAKQEKQ